MRLQSLSGVASLEVRLTDSSGSMILIFTGRRQIAGFKPGVRLTVQGMVGEHGGRLAVINPLYEIVAAPDHELPPTSH
jgi:hypothetical protein